MVSRALSAEMLAALQRHLIKPVTFVELDWPTDYIRAHSRRGTLTWGSNDWTGVGPFGAVQFPTTTRSVIQQTASLILTVPPDAPEVEVEQPVRNKLAKIHWGLLDIDTDELIPTPVEEFVGRVDAQKLQMTSAEGGVQTVIQIDLVSGVPARRTASVTHSFEDQITRFPGDTAGRHLWDITTTRLHWGG